MRMVGEVQRTCLRSLLDRAHRVAGPAAYHAKVCIGGAKAVPKSQGFNRKRRWLRRLRWARMAS
jgi:hypothetical protein